MDWTGLLAWTIDQKNGEKFDTSIKPMDDQTKKWLLEALESFQVDEFKTMKELLEKIALPEKEDSEDQRLDWFDQLQELLDALDRANDFCKIGGLALMFNYYQTTKFDSIKLQILRVITNSNQNNTFVQEYSGENNHLILLNDLDNQKNIKIKEQLIGALSSIIRGECLKNKRRFIDMNGIERILAHLESNRCMEKAINLIRDLLYYDEVLHQTYHDLSKFSNTTGQMQKQQNSENYSLSTDINDDLKKNNELPENQKYKGIVKKILKDLQFNKLIEKFCSDTSYKNSEARVQFLSCIVELNQYKDDQNLKEFLKIHYNKLVNEQDKDEGEINLCKQIL